MPKVGKMIVDDLRAAIMLLTRLPVWSAKAGGAPNLSRSAWVYPMVGTLVGSIGGATLLAAEAMGINTAVSVLIMMTVMTLATGAFHEDGLADTADGIGGGWTKERKLEIMRDSRIGTYGTVALLLSLGLRAAALISIADVVLIILASVMAATVSRAGIVVLLFFMAPARSDGMGTVAENPPVLSVVVALVFAMLTTQIIPYGIMASITGAIGLFIVFWLGKKHLGGYTGDLLGAGQQISEIFILVSLSTLLQQSG